MYNRWTKGVRVEVILKRAKELYGKRGTLTGNKIGTENFEVMIDGMRNPALKSGGYYLERGQLRIVRPGRKPKPREERGGTHVKF